MNCGPSAWVTVVPALLVAYPILFYSNLNITAKWVAKPMLWPL